jgi:hypothetical protein
MDSYLAGLVRGNGDALQLSEHERLLLGFALETFGEALSQFLLAGLGENVAGRVWLFAVTFVDEQGATRRREIRVEADEQTDFVIRLPCRREPLVLLALFELLFERGALSMVLAYTQEEVLSLLGWENNYDEARLAVDEAVRRYSKLSYYWSLTDEELRGRQRSFYRGVGGIISGYRHEDVEEAGEISRVVNELTLSAAFVEDLLHRTLFGVAWDNVRDIYLKVLG